ncbi:MAG: hypothetical protein M5R36_00555 [Deltaproteobacteria bacterium]|nr:hypothetical protein [Deltaproteobacteria bacterium]
MPAIDAEALTVNNQTSDYYFVAGELTIPIYQEGDIPYVVNGGAIKFDDNGDPVVQQESTIRFSLSVPKGGMPEDGWPLLVYSHGSGGSWTSVFNGVATWMARNGIAATSIDAPHHGMRNPISDDGDWESFCFYNALNPEAFKDNPVQAGIELMAVQRLVTELRVPQDLVPSSDASESPDGKVGFDLDATFFMGHSQGSTVAPAIVPIDPFIRAAYFSGAGAGVLWTMLTKTEPFPVRPLLALGLGLKPWEAHEQLDEFHPALNIVAHLAENVDGVSLNTYLVDREVPGASPKHIFQSQGITDLYVPIEVTGIFAASAGMDMITPVLNDDAIERIELAGGMLIDAETVTANRLAWDGLPVTAILAQYPAPPSGRDGHFVTWEFPSLHRRIGCFFRTYLDLGTPILVDDDPDEFAACLD